MNMLKRYRRHFKLPIKQGSNKSQLADVSIHFTETSHTQFFTDE